MFVVQVAPICQRGGLSVGADTTTSTETTTARTTTTTDYSLHVELRGGSVGSSEAYGNVYAVNSNSYFGPVCDDVWGSSHADVVCRQLGYARGDAYKGSRWGSVPSDFAMDEVTCRGDEKYLQECTYRTSEDCSNSEGAGVWCYSS